MLIVLILGMSISLISLLICWIPIFGMYSLLGILGSILCAIVWFNSVYKNIAMVGIVIGIIAFSMGYYWFRSISNSGGHLF
ncbi:hypothetical protein MNBD_GAMMA01-1161 [hydrothermal vent metagenome]|uniref:Uncharacterized protein n=1 Tax=hydrothermal vent metagenome TaxID=652676 RepID=A0A3B0UP44_9ZZZZ